MRVLCLNSEIIAEHEGGHQDHRDHQHRSERGHGRLGMDVVDTHLSVHGYADNTRFAESPTRRRLLSCRQKFETRDEVRVRVPDSLYFPQIESRVNVHNSLRHSSRS